MSTQNPPRDPDALALLFAELCVAAGAIAMEVFTRENIAARVKNDSSPVTEADERIEAFLLSHLSRRLPSLPLIAEERAARGETPSQSGAFLLIDPLDGTREFLARRLEFTLNIALIESGAPRAGAVYAPALGQLWFAGEKAFFAEAAPGGPLPPRENWRPLRTRKRPEDGMTALVSRSHVDAQTESFLARQHIKQRIDAGSSLKFCRLAEGVADIYPRFGPTMEWDTAAGDAVLRAAGGGVLTLDGAPLLYGKSEANYRNGAFIAYGDPGAARLS
ncbi:MAG: 3'(2'),5'-bisphosphate nucleotidase CysQ [Methylocystis sp.]